MRAGVFAALTTLAVVAPAAAAPPQVLYVGDSLGVGTTPGLARQLGTAARVHGDSRIGRPSGEGLRVLRRLLTPADDVVVFDLGTNDDPARPRALAADLAAARQATGSRCLIVATLNRPPLNGVSVDGLNQALLAFARGEPKVQLVDWNAVAQSEPELLAPDRVHPTPEGYAVRAQLFADAVAACSNPPRTGGGVVDETISKKRPTRKRTRKRPIRVPGIESSGISFTEPVAFRGPGARLAGELLLPNTKPPFPAVVMLHDAGAVTRDAYRREAEAFASHGIATLIYDKRSAGASTGDRDYRYSELAADARAAVGLLARRDDIRSDRIALWGVGEGAYVVPMVAAANPQVAAVLVVSPAAVAPAVQQDWRVRHGLGGSGRGPISTYYRLAASVGHRFTRRAADLGFDPAPWWRKVRQPVLAVWGTDDAVVPIRASALALKQALEAGVNHDRTFRSFTGADHSIAVASRDGEPLFARGFLDLSVRWLRSRLRPSMPPHVDAVLPPGNGGQSLIDGRAAGLAAPAVQAAWLLLPLALVGLAFARGHERRRLGCAVACALVALAAVGAGVAVAVMRDGTRVNHIAGLPALFALAFALTAAAAVMTVSLARRREWPAVVGLGAWIGFALFWLL